MLGAVLIHCIRQSPCPIDLTDEIDKVDKGHMFIFIQRTEAQRDSVTRSHRESVVELEMNLDFPNPVPVL